MPQEVQIQRFAAEKIAFYLHKKRDFLMRLENHQKGKKNTQDENFDFKNLLEALNSDEKVFNKINQQKEDKNF